MKVSIIYYYYQKSALFPKRLDDKLMQRSRFPAFIMPMASNFQVFGTGPKTFS